MKRETIFLKIALLVITVLALAICGVLLPFVITDTDTGSRTAALVLYGIIGIIYVSAIPFFGILFQAYKLLGHIDNGDAFSDLSVRALRNIKALAGIISILYVAAMPLFYLLGKSDDAPGKILIGTALIFAPLVVAVFAAVLQKLLQTAIEIKEDQELTI